MQTPASRGGGDQHLQAAQQEHGARQLPQPFERQLQPDGEEQEDDAELRQGLRRVDIADQVEEGRADEQAGREVADDGAELQPLGERGPDDGGRQDDKRIDEDAEISPVHPPPIAVPRRCARCPANRLYGTERRDAAKKWDRGGSGKQCRLPPPFEASYAKIVFASMWAWSAWAIDIGEPGETEIDAVVDRVVIDRARCRP